MKKHKNKQNNRSLVIGIVALVVVIFLVIFLLPSKKSSSELEEFAKCLTEKGAVMYGAFWCPHCANTKKKFGESFRYINYVECDPRGENEQAELCIEKEILSYDTWTFSDGSRLISEPKLKELAEKTSCPLPEEYDK
ncbi:MAG: hypothetical protein Q8P57_02970 [Candidatus Pacearchaeota archaeon]|nr:hypothetical protein [Candidatus Pacearchaeota archaeon]